MKNEKTINKHINSTYTACNASFEVFAQAPPLGTAAEFTLFSYRRGCW